MDWNITWLLSGALAFLFALIHLIRAILSKRKGNQVFMLVSLSCGAFTVLEEYRAVGIWLQHGEMMMLNSTVSRMIQILTVGLFSLIILNVAALLVDMKKKSS